MIIVHLGRGNVAIRQEAEFVDRTVEAPRVQQRPRLRNYRLMDDVARARRMERAHTNYKPGKLIELGNDQCRYIAGTDLVMCGAKCEGESAWCQKHGRLIYDVARAVHRNDQRVFST